MRLPYSMLEYQILYKTEEEVMELVKSFLIEGFNLTLALDTQEGERPSDVLKLAVKNMNNNALSKLKRILVILAERNEIDKDFYKYADELENFKIISVQIK